MNRIHIITIIATTTSIAYIFDAKALVVAGALYMLYMLVKADMLPMEGFEAMMKGNKAHMKLMADSVNKNTKSTFDEVGRLEEAVSQLSGAMQALSEIVMEIDQREHMHTTTMVANLEALGSMSLSTALTMFHMQGMKPDAAKAMVEKIHREGLEKAQVKINAKLKELKEEKEQLEKEKAEIMATQDMPPKPQNTNLN